LVDLDDRSKGDIGDAGIPFFILLIPLLPPFLKGGCLPAGRQGGIRRGSNLLSKLKVFVYDRKNKEDGFV
jgi:hypothetical protein